MNNTLEMLEKLQGSHRFNDNEVLNLFPLIIEEEKKLRVYFS